ncbi:hypothetical protein [Telmatospirillum sp.]|uniref:hypothetical protein n=1 Tax=Telmatospirillum sp. TaxID=2079197 RepID=UPI00284D2F41|nr:hypothetical protein [Telmatospirillum sp.]MDR3436354.1 hypothetical protein [Telmatospirillum sp.]
MRWANENEIAQGYRTIQSPDAPEPKWETWADVHPEIEEDKQADQAGKRDETTAENTHGRPIRTRHKRHCIACPCR